jgi:eukaryotic-like serine/threonine-protein kinase
VKSLKLGTGEHTWTEIEPHLNELFECSSDTRETYLAELAKTQPSMATTLREFMLEHDKAAASGFLEQPLDIGTDQSLAEQQLGAYTIKSLIGRGGMGEVWLASRSDGRFEGQFAVKFLDSFTRSPLALDRFRREGRLLARLTHGNIARLIDAGITSQGRPYLVLEYVAGESIERYCGRQSLSLQARVDLMLQVASAVAHAQSHLIVHRDIKPSNVLITAEGNVKLLDFGIAKLLAAEGAETAADLTRVEDSALTPEYAAPEQILGEPVSTATDVYQLGVLLFVLLTGTLPLPKLSGTRAERIKAALESTAPRASERSPPQLRPQLRGDLDAIVAKALRKRPEERYVTAAALRDDLQRYLDHRPVGAREGVFGYTFRKFVRRYRTAVIASAAAIVALIGTATFAIIQMRQAQQQRDALALQARRSDMQAQFVTLMLSSQQEGRTPKELELLLDKGLELLDKHYPNDPKFRANMLINMSGRFMDLGDTEKEYGALVKAEVIARELHDDALLAEVECDTVDTEATLGHLDRAAQRLESGRAALARVEKPQTLTLAYCMDAQASYAEAQGRTADAIATLDQETTLLERAKETRDVQYPSVLSHLALLYSNSGNTKKGIDLYERQLAALEANGQVDTTSYQLARENVAVTLMNFGELRSGCERFGEPQVSRQMGEDVKGTKALNWAICVEELGEPLQALDWYARALKVAANEQNLTVELHTHANRARALTSLKRFAEADADLEALATLAQKDAGASLRPATLAQVIRARWLFVQGRSVAARTQLDPLISAMRDPKSNIGSYLPTALLLASRIATAQGRTADAASAASEALALFEKRARNPESSADVGEALLVLAQAQHAGNDLGGARKSAARALVALNNGLGPDHPMTVEAKELQR